MPHVEQTPLVVRWVVLTIIFIAVTSFVSGIIFSWFGRNLDPMVADMGKVAFGSVTTLGVQLVSRNRQREDTPAGTPDDPVNVDNVDTPKEGE